MTDQPINLQMEHVKRCEVYQGAVVIGSAEAKASDAAVSAMAGDLQGAMIRLDGLREYLRRVHLAYLVEDGE